MPQAFELAVQIRGKGYPILCLHGHPGSARSMAVLTDYLSQSFMTLAPDLRGYGNSQTRQEFEMLDHLTDLEALLDRHQIAECLVVGWSLGGIMAMELALKLTERIRGLVLIATAAQPRGNHPPISWQDNVYTGIAALLNQVRPGWRWNIERFGKRSLFRYLIQQHTETAYQYIAQAAVPAYLQTSGVADRALTRAIRQGYNRLPEIPQIQCPALVLIGSEDRHITAASSLETAQHLKFSEIRCYENTAHLFPWEVPDRVLQDIDRWIAQHVDLKAT
ncbi:MAG: alpha/beta hydrolase [Oculatellaceae cyanobacterium Prado106]|jgi:proline iminopeptidase|nr:alpha/beta hydrolase [Oculatellaceae cyanobacterium Prado106]